MWSSIKIATFHKLNFYVAINIPTFDVQENTIPITTEAFILANYRNRQKFYLKLNLIKNVFTSILITAVDYIKLFQVAGQL